MKVALAHDFLRNGGAERVLESIHRIWPDAPVHTLLHETHARYADWDIRPSWLQHFVPPKRYRWPLVLYPGIIDRLDFGDIDLLISSSVSWMKGAATRPGTPHLCYCHRPMMFAYERSELFLESYPALLRPALRRAIRSIREWDQRTADNTTLFVANSAYTASKIERIYNRTAEVVHPPVRMEAFSEAGHAETSGGYFLVVSRLERYKRIDLAVEACTRLGLPLKVAGTGPMSESLKELAGPGIEFLGYVPDEELPALVAGCRAFLFPPDEDFGIAPVEAQAAGRPVLAYGFGGSLETVLAGQSGEHFAEQEIECVTAALEQFTPESYAPDSCRASAARFHEDRFAEKMVRLAERLVGSAQA